MIKSDEKRSIFLSSLAKYKLQIDNEIDEYCKALLNETYEGFGDYPAEVVKAYCDILKRGGKRIRGALAITSYKMFGGENLEAAVKAALAVEMLHAYILVVDDVQDRSELRRGGPTGHVALRNYHKKHYLKGDSQHFGESLALNGALIGLHSGLNVIADLDLPDEQKMEAIKNINQNFIVTAHGQSMDIFGEANEITDERTVDQIMLWKTVHYTFLNPLQLGAILAGASEKDIKKLERFSLYAGRAFQITDDILGVFGDEKIAGKSSMDDIREGKRTLLTAKALELSPKSDAYFLEQMLGNSNLTKAEFLQCRSIIEKSGALNYARLQAKNSVVDALAAINRQKDTWGSEQIIFLEQLVKSLIDRKS